MSDPPRQAAETGDPQARVLRRIVAELNAHADAPGARAPEQTLAKIALILARAGYHVAGREDGETERFMRLWTSLHPG